MSKQKDPARFRLDAKLRDEVILYLVHKADVKLEDPIDSIEIDYHKKPWGSSMMGIYVNGKIVAVINSTSANDEELFDKLNEYYNKHTQGNSESIENSEPIEVNVDREIPLNYNYLLEMRERYKGMIISPWVSSHQKFIGTYSFDGMIEFVMIMSMDKILDMLAAVMRADGWTTTPPDEFGYSLILTSDSSDKMLDSKTLLFYTVVYNALSQNNKKRLATLTS